MLNIIYRSTKQRTSAPTAPGSPGAGEADGATVHYWNCLKKKYGEQEER
jgi:hypothetical protein